MKTLLPILVWCLLLVISGPEFLHAHWESALIQFAALALVPPGLQLLGRPFLAWHWLPVAGLCAGFWLFPQPIAPWLSLPYVLWALWETIRAGLNVLVYRKFSLPEVIRVFALGYWATGAAFAGFFLAGFGPLGFDAVLVGLTAAHFHLAGFVLTVVAYRLYRFQPGRTNRILALATLAGMPLVATGIVLTKLGYSPVTEWASALGFAALALAVAGKQAAIAFDKKNTLTTKYLWLAGSACLFAGAVLAILYALRFHWPLSWINIPNMKIWHGTLNALGFGWLSLTAWKINATPN